MTSKQREIPMLGEVRAAVMVDAALIAQCRDMLDAVRLCVHLSGMSNEALSQTLGIDPGHWSRMMQGRAHFPTRKMCQLMQVARNLAPLQWLSHAMGFGLQSPEATRIAALEAELSAIRARAA